MTLRLMIIDEWFVFEGVVLVVVVLLDCLVHKIFVFYQGIIVGTFICKRGKGWCHLGNMRGGRGGFTSGLGVDGSKGGLRKGRGLG